jgi:hypothetical protein
MTVGALSAPVAVAIADTNESNTESVDIPAGITVGHEDTRDRADVKRQALRLEVRKELKAERKAEARKLAKKRAKKRAKQQRVAAKSGGTTSTATAGGGGASPHLEAIAACESGGDPGAIGGGGAYRGKYQFSYSTWAAVGGSGDPAAASEAEQDQRAAMLYSQAGAGQWPVCGQ